MKLKENKITSCKSSMEKSGITNLEKGQFLFVGLNMIPIYLSVNFLKQCRNILKALIPIVEPHFKFLWREEISLKTYFADLCIFFFLGNI